jgi:hypothetical protein
MADSTFDFLKNYDTSIAPLKAAYQQQAAQGPTGMFANVDPVMLGLAQGFLSPTRSGGFGESLGLGLAGAQAPLEAIRKRQLTAQEKLAELEATRAKMAMEAPYREALAEYYRSGGSRGGDGGLSASQNRLYIEGKIAKIENALGDPKALKDLGFANEEQAQAALAKLNRDYLNYGGQITPADQGEAPAAKSNATSEGGQQPSGLKPLSEDDRAAAQDAIKRGALKSAVIQRLKEKGYSTEGLE